MKKVEKEFECIARFINESRNATIGLMNHASLSTYWTVGAYVSLRTKSGSWGDRTVDALCDYLKTRHPKLRGFSRRQIYNMIAFYDTYSSIEFKNIFDRLRLYEFVQSATAQIENDAIVHSADERIVPAVIVQSLTAQLGGSSAKPHAMPDFLSLATFTNHAEIINRCRSMEEKVFYQQIKDIYKTSIDYDPSDEMTVLFFKEVQNKLLWAVSEKTAAELVYYRANASLPMMGLTSTSTLEKVRKQDILVGKNYLNEDELKALKLIVEQYLAYAESQALAHRPMYMQDWKERLDVILKLNERNVLEGPGKISHELAKQKAESEYTKYKEIEKEQIHLESIKELDKDIKQLKRK